MAYVEHRYIPSSKFKHKIQINIFKKTSSEITGLTSREMTFSGVKWFAYRDESSLSKGEITGEFLEPSGVIRQSTDLDIVIKFSDQLFDALNDSDSDSNRVVFTYRGKSYQAIDFINVGGEEVYLSLVLRRVSHAAA